MLFPTLVQRNSKNEIRPRDKRKRHVGKRENSKKQSRHKMKTSQRPSYSSNLPPRRRAATPWSSGRITKITIKTDLTIPIQIIHTSLGEPILRLVHNLELKTCSSWGDWHYNTVYVRYNYSYVWIIGDLGNLRAINVPVLFHTR